MVDQRYLKFALNACYSAVLLRVVEPTVELQTYRLGSHIFITHEERDASGLRRRDDTSR